MLKRFGFEKTRPISTSMQTNKAANHSRRNREEDEYTKAFSSNTEYRGAIGSLLYLANATRPDICYATNALSRHQINPTESDWQMVKRVFQYLSGTKHYKLTFKAKNDNMFKFSDASLSDCKHSLITCGYIIKLFGDSVSWRAQKQSSVVLSTCQLEYVAISETSQEFMSLHNSIKFILGRDLCPLMLYCDNLAAQVCAKSTGSNRLTRRDQGVRVLDFHDTRSKRLLLS